MSTEKRLRRFGIVTALLGSALMAGEASATILLARQNINPQGDEVAPFPATNLELGGGQTVVGFSTSVPDQVVRVIFNAEASIGGATTNWLDTTILLDGFFCQPTQSDNALVSGNGTAVVNDGWVSAVTQCFRSMATAGAHTLSVQVTPNPAIGWRIDDLSLVIDTE